MSQVLDLVVIGGGIVGAFVSHMAKCVHREWHVGLLERRLVGQGASRYAAGVRLATGATGPVRELARQSEAVYAELADRLVIPKGHDVPVFWVIERSCLAQIESEAVGFTLEAPSAEQRARLYRALPDLALGTTEVLRIGGVANCGEPSLVARMLVESLCASDREAFVLLEGSVVDSIEFADDTFRICRADGQHVRAKRLVFAAGPWAPKLLGREVSGRLGLRVKKVVAFHLGSELPDDGIGVFFPGDDAYLISRGRGSDWLFSFASEAWDCDPDDPSLSIDATDRGRALAILERRVPALSRALRGGRFFCDVYVPDRVPHSVPHPTWERCVIAGAGCGAGYRLAPGIAAQVVEQLG